MMAALLPRWTEITMTVAGLPLHPLVVHAAVVLVPLAALALIATGWRASLRARFGAPLAIAAVVGWLAAFVASQSGDALAEEIEDLSRKAHDAIEGHEESGELAMITTLLFTLGAIALCAAQRYAGRLPTWAPTVVYGLASLAGLAAMIAMTLAGDSGARLVWQELGTFAPR
jgi:uncharacterized membrane protein